MAVIVTWNSVNVVGRCLDSLKGTPILVFDNASTDGTVEQVRERGVELIASAVNLGFAGAVNRCLQATTSEHVLILNPDVEVLGPLEELAKYPVAAGKLLSQNGDAQIGFALRRFPTPAALMFESLGINALWPGNPVNRRYRYLDRDVDQPGEVEQPAGAFLMIRRDVWQKTGGFDESFHPLWFEDVDFCLRAARAGFPAQYVPSVRARHVGGDSARQLLAGCRERYWYGSLLSYAAKHFGRLGYWGVSASVVLGAVPRMIAGMIRERNLTPLKTYSKIIGLASLSLLSGGPVLKAKNLERTNE